MENIKEFRMRGLTPSPPPWPNLRLPLILPCGLAGLPFCDLFSFLREGKQQFPLL